MKQGQSKGPSENKMEAPKPPIIFGRHYFQNPAFPLAAMFVEREGSREHGHDFVEIVLVASGSGTHKHRSPKGKLSTYDLIENDVFLVPIGWTHGYWDIKDLSIYNVIYAPGLIDQDFIGKSNSAEFYSLFAGAVPAKLEGLVYKLHLRHDVRQAAETVIKAMRREIMTRSKGYEMMAKAKLLEFLTLLQRASSDRPQERGLVSETQDVGGKGVADAIRFVEDNYHRPIGLRDVAEAAGLNANYLCERFADLTGISPMKYMTRLRVEHGKQLLLTTDASITQVAQRSGFCDSSYFTRVFRKHVGKTPRDFRTGLKVV